MSTDVQRTKKALSKDIRKAKQVPEMRCTGSETWYVHTGFFVEQNYGSDIIAELKAIILIMRRCTENVVEDLRYAILLFDRFCWKN